MLLEGALALALEQTVPPINLEEELAKTQARVEQPTEEADSSTNKPKKPLFTLLGEATLGLEHTDGETNLSGRFIGALVSEQGIVGYKRDGQLNQNTFVHRAFARAKAGTVGPFQIQPGMSYFGSFKRTDLYADLTVVKNQGSLRGYVTALLNPSPEVSSKILLELQTGCYKHCDGWGTRTFGLIDEHGDTKRTEFEVLSPRLGFLKGGRINANVANIHSDHPTYSIRIMYTGKRAHKIQHQGE
jgi:hypothetical protein